MNFKVPLFKIYWDQDDINSVNEIIKSGEYWADGKKIQEFEDEIAKYIGVKYAVSFNSGTSALHSILLTYNIKSKEVIVPSFTFISTANSVILAGGKPVFAESEGDTYGLDIESVEEKITNKTKAIIPLHYGGLTSRDIYEIKEIAKDNNILVIEDAAESIGSEYKGQKAGSIGDSAMFSFCQNKIITSGEGGVIVTNSKKIYKKLRLIRSHGRVDSKNNNYFSSTREMKYIDIGYNFRMPTMNAALGLSQLKKINRIIKLRREKADYYNKKFRQLSDIKLPIEKKYQKHVYQLYTIQFDKKRNRDKIQKHLFNNGIMTKVYFYPIHLKFYYRKTYGYKKSDLPNTEKISEKVLTLPLYPSLKNEKIDYIIDLIKEVY